MEHKTEAIVPITRALREQFLCPICYDTIENAHRVFPCLHYFCGSCIQKAFTTIQKVEDGKVKHYCPACRHVIPSKRHIVKDSNFDDIIRALKCSRDDAQPEEKIDITIYQQIHRARTQEMKSYQAANKERILSQPYRAPTTSSGTTKRSSVGIVIAGGGQKRGRKSGSSSVAERVQQPHVEETTSYLGLVNFSLKYYNAQNLNDENLNAKYSLLRPYVRADCSATMLDLKLLLCSYFTDRHENTVDLYVWNAQHATMIYMENDMSLLDYCTTLWNQEASIVFFYSLR